MGFALFAIPIEESEGVKKALGLLDEITEFRKELEKYERRFGDISPERFGTLDKDLHKYAREIFKKIGKYPRMGSPYRTMMRNEKLHRCWSNLREGKDREGKDKEYSLPKLMDIAGKDDYNQKDYIWRIMDSIIGDLEDFEYAIKEYIENERYSGNR